MCAGSSTRPSLSSDLFLFPAVLLCVARADLFGGGVPLSTLVLLKEDVYATASSPFVSSFLADGIGFGHRCIVVHEQSRRAAKQWIANATPRNVNLERDSTPASGESKPASSTPSAASAAQSDDLKIAWRYQQYLDQPMDARANLGAHKVSQLPAASSASPSASSAPKSASAGSSTTLSGSYDYHSSITSALLASNPPTIVSMADDILPAVAAVNPPLDPATANRLIYRNVLRAIALFLDQCGCVAGSMGSGPVARIVLPSLGSLGWHVDASTQSEGLLLFLMHLRQLLSTRRAIALLSMPTALFPPPFMRAVAHWCHAAFALQSFAGAGSPSLARVAQQALGDYDGLLRLEKAPTLHSLQPSVAVAGAVAAPELSSSGSASVSSAASAAASAASSSCFLFKCARRKIVIEKFALPPEDEEADAPADASSVGQIETAHAAPKPASVRSTKPPPNTAAATAPSSSRGRIELEDSDSAPSSGLAHSAAHLSRRPGTEVDKVDPRRAKVRDANETLSSIVRGRATGCSSSHQLPGKMDF